MSLEPVAAPLSALLLVLLFAVTGASGFLTVPAGEDLLLADLSGESNCGDGMPVFVRLVSKESGFVNRKKMPVGPLQEELERIFSMRAERLLLLSIDRDLPVDMAVSFMDEAHRRSSDLHVALVADSMLERVQRTPRLLECTSIHLRHGAVAD